VGSLSARGVFYFSGRTNYLPSVMNPLNPSHALPSSQNLQVPVDKVLNLLQQEPTLRAQIDTSAVRSALKKAIAPTFEIVFAGAFSAGKSMLINALLERASV
jgi:uncharacterized protein YPO0396